ncbi:tail fiber domain-containing protein [Candidatus Parcubacteria bacterium]|nr:tail fiber domain-containing protein [Candidatus Parcubacteria bacterium]
MNKKAYIASIAVSLLFATPAWAQTWTGPSQAAPGGNTPTPVNVGSTAQSKIGGLLLNTGGATNGLIVQYGNVGIGAVSPGYKLEISGNVGATAYFYTSDRRLKTDVKPLSGALSKILSLDGVSFSWKADGKPSVGLIAQDVEKIFPELVGTNAATGLKSVEYGNLVAPLIEAIKEQQKEIDSLKAEIQALKGR